MIVKDIENVIENYFQLDQAIVPIKRLTDPKERSATAKRNRERLLAPACFKPYSRMKHTSWFFDKL
jgi:hypothetical protein